MKTDLSKVSALEYAKKFEAVMKSLGGSVRNCSSVNCGACPLKNKITSTCLGTTPSNDSIQAIMDYEIPVDWDEVQKRADNGEDVKILICDDGVDWERRYFAKYENGKVYAYNDGATKWSVEGGLITDWNYAKLAEEE